MLYLLLRLFPPSFQNKSYCLLSCRLNTTKFHDRTSYWSYRKCICPRGRSQLQRGFQHEMNLYQSIEISLS